MNIRPFSHVEQLIPSRVHSGRPQKSMQWILIDEEINAFLDGFTDTGREGSIKIDGQSYGNLSPVHLPGEIHAPAYSTSSAVVSDWP